MCIRQIFNWWLILVPLITHSIMFKRHKLPICLVWTEFLLNINFSENRNCFTVIVSVALLCRGLILLSFLQLPLARTHSYLKTLNWLACKLLKATYIIHKCMSRYSCLSEFKPGDTSFRFCLHIVHLNNYSMNTVYNFIILNSV